MSKLPRYQVWDGSILHNVAELHWCAGGVKWCGPGVGEGWVKLDKSFHWANKQKPKTDLLLEVVEI